MSGKTILAIGMKLLNYRTLIFKMANLLWRKPLKLSMLNVYYVNTAKTEHIRNTKEATLLEVLKGKITHLAGYVETFEVPTHIKGKLWKTDFASVPQVLQALFSSYVEFLEAVLKHDYDYEIKSHRKRADQLLYLGVKGASLSEGEARLIYYAVRLGRKRVRNRD